MNQKSKNIVVSPDDDDYVKVSSAQDCTGLIPAGIQDDEEVKNYEELYPFLPRAITPKKKSSLKNSPQ